MTATGLGLPSRFADGTDHDKTVLHRSGRSTIWSRAELSQQVLAAPWWGNWDFLAHPSSLSKDLHFT